MSIIRERNYYGKTPLLYLIATPIGNLSEFSSRAQEILSSIDFVACEDTRNTSFLLSHFGLNKTLISCHEHNEEMASEKVLSLLSDGKNVAYMSDAGYPCLSDPGTRLAKKVIEHGFKVAVINGPNAALCALVASGLDTNHYYFHGFLDARKNKRDKELLSLKDYPFTLIFYEAPHRISDTLDSLKNVLGGDRNACLCRELTKLNEEYIRGTLEELSTLEQETLKGEMVIVVEGKSQENKQIGEEEVINSLEKALKTLSGKDSVSKVSKDLGLNKNDVYAIYLNNFKK